MRYIDADKLKERLEIVSVVADDLYGMGINSGLHRAEIEVNNLPTEDVVPRKEVAWIFEKIEEEIVALRGIEGFIKRLKKKYTKGGEE